MQAASAQTFLPNAPHAALVRSRGVAPKLKATSRQISAAAQGTVLENETFASNVTVPLVWRSLGDACLTAGNANTTSTSIPACGAHAAIDPVGSGALQLTTASASQVGMALLKTKLSTANGLVFTFNDYAFSGTTPGSDGIAFFLTDASLPLPTAAGQPGSALGYAAANGGAGIAGAYVGVGLDEFGNYSSILNGKNGGPGTVPETIAVRGSAATKYQYLGGVQDASGKASGLPFAFEQPTLKMRPANPSTVRVTLTPQGLLSVAIDRHDGSGFVMYYSQSIVGVNGQPAVPANVYFGLSAATGGRDAIHQVTNLVVSSLSSTAGPPPLANPSALVSAGGSLVFNVTAQADANGNPRFAYNGSPVPPTLRLLPGDDLVVNFTNNLPPPPSGSGYTNATNLHYHGLHVSPQAPGDDSIDMLALPGQVLHYNVKIPTNHPPGLYWYHTHAHGEAERQTLAGMSGALVIDGIAAYTPAVSKMTERILIARDAPLAGALLPNANIGQIYAMRWAMQHGVSMHASHSGTAMAGSMRGSSTRSELHASSTQQTRNPYAAVDPNYRRFVRPLATSTHCVAGTSENPVKALTLNGQTQPSIAIAPGESQFWRVVNAGADTYLDLQIDNTQMQIIALDGVPLQMGVGTPSSMIVSHWVLPPASRVEFIVTGPPAGTAAFLRTNCFDAGPAGDAMPGALLASIAPSAATVAHNAVVSRVSPQARRFRFHRVAAIKSAAVSATRTIYYSDQNNINGIAYDPAAPPQFYAQSGTVEEWTIVNNSTQVHTFHIHQIHFVVEAINGTPQSQQYLMDNVNVPAGTASGPGTVKLLLDFTDPSIIGTFLLHCHILQHEDGGMMAKIRIGTAPPLSLSASSVDFASPTAAMQKLSITGGAAPYSLTGCGGVATAAVNGTSISILPAGTGGSCVLTVADGSSPSLTATAVITVAAAAPVLSIAPNAVSFAAPTAASQNVAISGGVLPYSVAGCGAIATGTINKQVLTVAPHASGTCSLVVSDASNNTVSLSVSVNAASTGNPRDNLTFHQNAMRTGWYQNETVLTAANVGSTNFGRVATLAAPAGMPAFGKVYAQPLFVTSEAAVDGKVHNLVIVAGSAGQVYAFDETTRAVVWHRSFTNSSAGIRQQLWSDTNCQDVNPDVGIIGTPVIDRARDAIYVVVATMENNVPYTRLHAIGLGNGNDLATPTVVSGSVPLATGGIASISSVGNMNRSALLEANGNIYVALASHCDQNAQNIHGWVAAYDASTLRETGNLADISNAFISMPNFLYLGAPWMSGYGPAADAQGNIYFATGNGPSNGTNDFAMSVLKVPGNLNLGAASYFTPIQAAADSLKDEDLGSGGVMLLPDQTGALAHLLVAGGKCSVGGVGCLKYILNRDSLGGQRTANAGAVWSADTGGGIWGGPAYFVDATGVQHILYGVGPLNTYNLNLSPVSLAVQSSTNVGCFVCRNSGSQPIVSSNGRQAGSAIAWAIKTPGNSGGTMYLYAFDPLKMQTTLFTAAVGSWLPGSGASTIAAALVSPVVANGRVYVPAQDSVSVFGLLH